MNVNRARPLLMIRVAALLVVACSDDDAAEESAGSSATVANEDGATTTTRRGGCENGHWPSVVLGEPQTLAAADVEGYYVWNDYTGWHVRFVNTSDDPQRMQGRVVSSARIVHANANPVEAAGVTVTANEIAFDMEVGDAPVGVDVNVGCPATTVRFELNGEDGPFPVEAIFVGPEGRAPANPLTFERIRGPG